MCFLSLDSVEELLASLKKMDDISGGSRKSAAFLHLDGRYQPDVPFS
jgi:hypothetical protein